MVIKRDKSHPKVSFGKNGILIINLGTPKSTKKKDIKGTVAPEAIRSEHVISIKSRRPRRRFSLLPRGERSGRLRSRRPRGSLKFPLPSRRLSRRLNFPSLGAASFVASPRCCWSSFSQARPPIRYGAPTLPPRAAAHPFWLAWGSRSKASSSSTASSTATLSLSEISASVRSSCLCATPPLCF